MKKIFTMLFLLPALVFSACTAQEEPLPSHDPAIIFTPYEMPAQKNETVSLYYPSADNSHVLASTQQLKRKNQESFYFDVMDALLHGTDAGYKSIFPEGVQCRNLMLVQNILYIDMSWHFSEMAPELFCACLSVLISTYTDFPEIEFINITVEGKQLTVPGLPQRPLMLFSAYSGTISDLLNRYKALLRAEENSEPVIDTFYAVVYTQDESQRYLLPQTVSITIQDNDYASAIVSALISLEAGTDIFTSGFTLASAPEFQEEKKTLQVTLTAPPSWTPPSEWLAPQAIVSALDCIYPGTEYISLTVQDAAGNSLYSHEEEAVYYFNFIRSQIDIFTPSSAGNELTHTSMLVSRMPGSGDLSQFIHEYICTIHPALRETDGLVNNVLLNGDTVIIDLGEEYFNLYTNLTPEQEYAAVYSMVITACSYSGATKAQLLQNGQTRSCFSKNIRIDHPLLNLPDAYIASLKQA